MKRAIAGLWVFFILLMPSFLVPTKLFSGSEKVLAKVGDRAVTQGELDELLKIYEPLRRETPFSIEDKKRFLGMLVNSLLISMEAEKEKMDQRPEIQMKLRLSKIELLTKEYIETKISPLVTVKEEEVEEIMKRNPHLVPKETLQLKEIVVKTEKEAEEIYQLLKKGADFSKLAGERSISQSWAKGGLAGAISRGQLPPPLEAVAFNLKEGEFSRPFKTEEGFGIYYLVNRKELSPEKVQTLDRKVREKIVQLEKKKKIEAVFDKRVEELKKQVNVETYFDRLE